MRKDNDPIKLNVGRPGGVPVIVELTEEEAKKYEVDKDGTAVLKDAEEDAKG